MAVTTAAVIGAGAAVKGTMDSRKAAKQANKTQEEQFEGNQAFIKEQAEKAREDVLPLFSSAMQNRLLGGQAAMDIFSRSVPQQVSAVNQGSLGAQQALLSGLPQMQNAILGRPVDMSSIMAMTGDPSTDAVFQGARPINANTNFINKRDMPHGQSQMPNFNQSVPLTQQEQGILNALPPEVQLQQAIGNSQLLSGLSKFGRFQR